MFAILRIQGKYFSSIKEIVKAIIRDRSSLNTNFSRRSKINRFKFSPVFFNIFVHFSSQRYFDEGNNDVKNLFILVIPLIKHFSV